MAKVATSNSPTVVAGKPGSNMYKIPLAIAVLAAIGAALYGKFMMENETNVDASKFPLGQYPLAYQIGKSEFYELIGNKTNGRKHNTFVIFNALDPGAGCQICPTVDGYFKDLTKNFPVSEHLAHNIAFATAELGKSRDLFQELQIQTAPWLMFFKASPAGITPTGPVAFNIKKPMVRDAILAFINENLGTKISLKKQRTAVQKAGLAAGPIAIVGICALAFTGKLGSLIFNPWLAMILSTLFIVLMNSGYMFCKVRGMPYSFYAYAPTARITPTLQAQTGAEIWMVGFLSNFFHGPNLVFTCLALINAAAAVVLGAAVPKIRHPVGKRIAVLLFIYVMMFGFDAQLQIFKKKLPSYPYKLFPF